MGEFFKTLWGKIIAALSVVALLIGIAAEAVSLFRGWQEAEINRSRIEQAKAEACAARAKGILETVGRRGDQLRQSNQALDQIAKECGEAIANIISAPPAAEAAKPTCPDGSKWDSHYEKCNRSFQHKPDSIDTVVQKP